MRIRSFVWVGSWTAALLLSLNCYAASPGAATLVDAVKNQDRDGIRALLRETADVNAAEPDGTTALHWAAHWGDLETVELLIRAGANVRASNRYGSTPLSEAVNSGGADLIEALLKGGADPNTPITSHGQTVLMTAARAGNGDAVRVLLRHGAYVDSRENFRGQTALMWAAAEGHAGVVRLLLESNADHKVRSLDRDTTPPKMLPGTPAAPINRGGLTALLFAARDGQLEATRALLDGGAEINQTDSDGNNALVLAILNKNYDLAELLLERGADPKVANKEGRTALYTAVDMQVADWSPLPARMERDNLTSLDVIRSLLTRGADVNAQLTDASPIKKVAQDGGDRSMAAGATPFMRAARSADTALMRLLLEHGADPTLAATDGLTALMIASGISWSDKIQGSEAEALETIQFLVELGLDVNAATEGGDTPLHGAAHRGADSIVKYLFDQGALLDAKNKQDLTPLDIAMGKGAAPGAYRQPHVSTVALIRELMGLGEE